MRVYVTGARTWRTMPDWPPPTTDRTWYLAPDGRLADDAPAEAGATTFRYDPMNPTPSVGGRVLAGSAGQRDNRELEARDDVVLIFDVGDANQTADDGGLAAFVARSGGSVDDLEIIETQRYYGLHLRQSKAVEVAPLAAVGS